MWHVTAYYRSIRKTTTTTTTTTTQPTDTWESYHRWLYNNNHHHPAYKYEANWQVRWMSSSSNSSMSRKRFITNWWRISYMKTELHNHVKIERYDIWRNLPLELWKTLTSLAYRHMKKLLQGLQKNNNPAYKRMVCHRSGTVKEITDYVNECSL